MGEIYLDYNATTPPHPEVVEVMREALATAWGNPSSVHAAGRRARALLEEAREAVADLLGVSPRDVVFTSGGTEANNLALFNAPAVVTSRLEHPSVVRVAEQLEARGAVVRWLAVEPSGRVEVESVREALAGMPPKTVVAIQAANHETGVLQPVEAIYSVARDAGARVHVDAVQVAGKLDPVKWRVFDSVSISAHKLRGPKGVGVLAFRPDSAPKPLLVGGAQERGLRGGTQDAALAAGFRVALRLAEDGPARFARVALLRDALEAALEDVAQVNGEKSARLPHVSNLSFTGARGDEVVAAMDLHGVRISSGSACSAGSSEPSPVITAMLGRERAERAVRISFGDDASEVQVTTVIALMRRVLGAPSLQ